MKKFKELPSEHRAQETVSELNAKIKEQGDELKLTEQTLKAREGLIKELEKKFDEEKSRLAAKIESLTDADEDLNLKRIMIEGSFSELKKTIEE